MAPTATDEKLAEKIQGVAQDLADFRVEVAERFGTLERDISGFRSGVETELRIIRKLGTWLLGGVFGLIAALITGAATIGWSASEVVAEVKHQGPRSIRSRAGWTPFKSPPIPRSPGPPRTLAVDLRFSGQ